MSKINKKSLRKDSRFDENVRLAGGGGQMAAVQSDEAQLRRSVLACLLWENTAYQSGNEISDNIAMLIPKVDPAACARIVEEARHEQKLRHVPLFMISEMAKYPSHRKHVEQLINSVCTRADQLTDLLSIYWRNGRVPLANSIKRGLASAFTKFDEYQLAKYDRDAPVLLRDVMFLTHPKPQSKEQEEMFKRVASRTLTTPKTWETMLSSGADKKETFTTLINEKKLGGLAFIRNMHDSGVGYSTLKKGFDSLSRNVLLPLNFYTAYKTNPTYAREIEDAMLKAYSNLPKLPGHTVFVVDVSGSMQAPISQKSRVNRMEAAASLAVLAAETAERITIYATAGSWSEHKTARVANVRGFGMADKILESKQRLGGGGIFTRQCLDYIKKDMNGEVPDRIIVFSDSQDCDTNNRKTPDTFGKNNYIVDVSSHTHGVNYKGVWTAEISGWSENLLTYIRGFEGLENNFVENS